jgi:hypothetical protein
MGMIPVPPMRGASTLRLAGLLGMMAVLATAGGAFELRDSNDITAVSGRTSPDYVRSRQANGSFTPETYAFGNGGLWGGAMKDESFEKMTFLDVAHVIAQPLADKNYLPSRDPKNAKLLIMVYWGTTHGTEHASSSDAYTRMSALMGAEMHPPTPQAMASTGAKLKGTPASEGEMVALAAIEAENRIRDKDDALNAAMLGYDSWWFSVANYRDTPLDIFRKEMLEELEANRYFVVLMAYDFQLMWKQKKHKLLWETRFSVRQRGHNFDQDLASMADAASKYFGQDSQGLVRTSVPFAHVDIGEVKSLGAVPDK